MSNRTLHDYTVMVFVRGDTKWSLLARERKPHKCWAAAMRFRDAQPPHSCGRFLFGACDRDMPADMLAESIAALPAPEFSASH